MSLIDRIHACTRYDLEPYLPLEIDGDVCGHVRPSFADLLRPYEDVFERHEGGLRLPHGTSEQRTAAIERVAQDLEARGRLPGWRGEHCPVVFQWGDPPLCTVERSLIHPLGLPGFGVHLNGYVKAPDGLRIWVGQRSATKQTDPGRLDHLVGGGQPAGVGLRENMVKECAEEASIPEALVEALEPAVTLRHQYERANGLHQDTVFVFDLALPASFVPRNDDGEVAFFELWTVPQMIEALRDPQHFKLNCTVVIIDFLLRHGLLDDDAEHASLEAAVAGLRGPVHPSLLPS